MDRRRFLKYAGATTAVVGASVLGLDYLLRPTPPIKQTLMSSTEAISTTSLSNTSSVTTTETSTSGELPPPDLGPNDLGGYVFHDYNGNGALDEGEPYVNDVEIVAQGYNATFKAEPQNGIYVFKNLLGDRYRLYPVHPQNKFRYMCRSNAELVETKQGYTIDFRGSQRLDMALMEGFLTLPFSSKTTLDHGDLYDRDPNPDTYLYWDGEHGLETRSPGFLKSGGGLDKNHYGIDYITDLRTPILAQAPGTVGPIGYENGNFIWIYHDNGYRTSSGHIAEATVKVGDRVLRGQQIAVSGMSGAPRELNYHVTHQQLVVDYTKMLDPYAPVFEMKPEYSGYYDFSGGLHWQSAPINSSNPNMLSYWTKDNGPQYSTT